MTQKSTAETLPITFDPVDLLPEEPIPIETIIEYRTKHLTYAEIGKLTGCTKQNIHQRLQPIINQLNAHDNFKKHRADIFSIITQKGLRAYLSLTTAEQKELIMKRGLVDVGIAYDKMKAELGEGIPDVAIHIVVQEMKALKSANKRKMQGETDGDG